MGCRLATIPRSMRRPPETCARRGARARPRAGAPLGALRGGLCPPPPAGGSGGVRGGAAGMPMATLESADGASAGIYLHGAHVTSWRPAPDGDERLFLTAPSEFGATREHTR